MDTHILEVDPLFPQPERIEQAAVILRQGGLVAFPTETVYGLGGNALDRPAVASIFLAKGRPASNPVIVHLADPADVLTVAAAWPDQAERLASRFWPGPLTLVLPRLDMVPDTVTAGGPTVAVRVPAHPVARALIRAAGLPIAAPSANRSGFLSPTRAEHVLRSLAGQIPLILDGGPTPGGIESTVLDLTTTPPRLLRPGLIARDDLEAVIGPIALPGTIPSESEALPSPGMLSRHYAPQTSLEAVADGPARVRFLRQQGIRAGLLHLGEPPGDIIEAGVPILTLPADPAGYAAGLYSALHVLDDAGLERIVATLPPIGADWLAVHDRLRRACH